MQPRIFHSLLKDCGLKFGNYFQSVTNLRYSDDGNSMETTNLHHFSARTSHSDLRSNIIHPASLDAFPQVTFLALTKSRKEALPTMVPTIFQNLWVSTDVSSPSADAQTHLIILKTQVLLFIQGRSFKDSERLIQRLLQRAHRVAPLYSQETSMSWPFQSSLPLEERTLGAYENFVTNLNGSQISST